MKPSSHNELSPLFAPVEKVRLFESVLDQLETLIDERRLVPGDRLPSERALSETLQVSRSSLREALRVLEAMNIITVRTGVGAAGGSIISNDVGPAISRFLRLYMALGHFTLTDLYELRETITSTAARGACEARTDDQVERLEKLVAEMGRATGSQEAYLELDSRFHLAIAMMAGNRLHAELVGAIRGALTQAFQVAPVAPGTWTESVRPAHEAAVVVVDAIRQRDAEAAIAALERRKAFYDLVLLNEDRDGQAALES